MIPSFFKGIITPNINKSIIPRQVGGEKSQTLSKDPSFDKVMLSTKKTTNQIKSIISDQIDLSKEASDMTAYRDVIKKHLRYIDIAESNSSVLFIAVKPSEKARLDEALGKLFGTQAGGYLFRPDENLDRIVSDKENGKYMAFVPQASAADTVKEMAAEIYPQIIQ